MENGRDNKGKMLKIRGKDDAQCRSGSTASVGADSSLSLLKFVAGLMIFVVGVIVGLLSGSHVDRYFARFSFKNVYSDADLYVPYNSVKRNVVCATDDLLSMMAFTARQNLSHGLRDDELFWRATLVPEKEEFPFQRVPKVAFMFLTRGPLPLLPLWERFFSGQDVERYSIFVHSPPEFELNVSIFSVFYQRRIPSKPVQWGSVSLVDGEKRLLANALLDFSNERFVLLSESCIPIYNFPTIYRYLVESDYSFVESYDDPSRYGRGRYSRRMRPDIELSDWRKGSQWFEMHRALAIKIVSDTKYYTLFSKYCKPSCYPDEHYIPTYTHKFFSNLNSNRTITYVDWSLIAPHPATFTEADITVEFIRKLRNNGTMCSYNYSETSICYLFARKFDPSALEALLYISLEVMGF